MDILWRTQCKWAFHHLRKVYAGISIPFCLRNFLTKTSTIRNSYSIIANPIVNITRPSTVRQPYCATRAILSPTTVPFTLFSKALIRINREPHNLVNSLFTYDTILEPFNRID